MSTEDKFPDWFSTTAKPNFEKYLIPLAGVDNLSFLQLGAYTGDASLWMLENVLTGQGSGLIDIDTWKGSDEEVHKSIDFDEVFNVYKQKVESFHPRVTWRRVSTFDYLTLYYGRDPDYETWDFIYIDADHTAVGVLMDAELSWPLLKPGGILAFDDYLWGLSLVISKAPKLGIDLFLDRHLGEYEILEQGLQVWLRKL
jgi:hypothetical protein